MIRIIMHIFMLVYSFAIGCETATALCAVFDLLLLPTIEK